MELQKQMEALLAKNPFVNKTDAIYTLILDEVLNGNLAGGQRLNQEDVSEQLGVSRSPVREAMNRLSGEGYLVKEAAAGYHVYRLKIEDYLAINEFRSMLEIFASELAVKNITSEELNTLKQYLVLTKKAVDAKDVGAFSKLDEQFHKLLILASRNPHIIQTHEHYERKFHLFRVLALRASLLPIALRWHKMIYDAVASGDSESAVKATRLHRENTVNGVIEMCKREGIT